MSAEVKIGVIGTGARSGLAHNAHRPEDGVRVVAGADLSRNALERFQKMFGPDVFVTTDYRELLKRDLDAVFVTTPDYLHEEHAVAALQAGKAIYLEKPMALTIDGCDRILRAARETGSKLYVGHNMRHMRFVLKMKELIDAGAIGDVKAGWCRHFVSYGGDAYFKDWHAERCKTNSLLLQKGAHDIDILHWLCGGYTRRVTGMGGLTLYDRVSDRHSSSEPGNAACNLANWPPLAQKGLNPVIDVEDINMILMELDNGVFASYQQCHYTPDAWRNYMIIGTEGRIENFGDGDDRTVVKVWNKRCLYNPDADREFEAKAWEGEHGGADGRIVAEFIRFVRGGGKITTSPVAARYSVATGCQAAESVRNGGVPMEVSKLDDALARYFEQSAV